MKIADTHTDDKERQKPITFNQFYVQKCANPNSGSCYGIFFSHKFGNFHTGNPVIRCIDLGRAVETNTLTPINNNNNNSNYFKCYTLGKQMYATHEGSALRAEHVSVTELYRFP